MSDFTVIDETTDDRFRVVLVQDTDASEPEDDGGAYVFSLDFRHWTPEVETRQEPTGDPYADDIRAGIARAMCRWGTDWDRLERYLRVMFDAVAVQAYDRRDGGRFLAVVTADMLANWGGNLALVRESNLLHDWEAWDEGDVYGYEIQRRVKWTTEDDELDDRETWEHEDSCWGFFGRDWAVEAAREALALFTSVRGAA